MHRTIRLRALGPIVKGGPVNRLPLIVRRLIQDVDARSVFTIWIDVVQHCLKLFICPVRYRDSHPRGREIDLTRRLRSRLLNLMNGKGRDRTDEGNPQNGKGCFHSAGLTPCLLIGKHKISGQSLADGSSPGQPGGGILRVGQNKFTQLDLHLLNRENLQQMLG